jgi:hypothetical protein
MRGDGLVGNQDDMLEVETKAFTRLPLMQRGRFLSKIRVATDRGIVRLPSNEQASKLCPAAQEKSLALRLVPVSDGDLLKVKTGVDICLFGASVRAVAHI